MINISRHSDVLNPTKHEHPIHIIGAGATGSRLFASLVELGFQDISVYDKDVVENHNLANQLFSMEDVGKPKVEALRDWAKQKVGEDLKHGEFVQEFLPHKEYPLYGTVFLLTDTMASRREIYESAIKGNEEIRRVIETRMASSYGNIFTFNPLENGDEWLDTLISDDDAEVSHCGSSISVGPTANIIANQAVWQFMLSMTDPDSVDDIVNIFLKPYCVGTDKWQSHTKMKQTTS